MTEASGNQYVARGYGQAIRLVDTHAHPQTKPFDRDRDEVLARAQMAGVETVIAVGFDMPSSRAALALAQRSYLSSGPQPPPLSQPPTPVAVWATLGIHPHDAKDATMDDFDEIVATAREAGVVALGEMGLDFFRNLSPHDVQREVFRRQLDLCARLDLPAVIHSRDAAMATFAILEPWARARRRAGGTEPFGVMHCYAYDAAMAARYVDLGFMISIPGTVTYPDNARGQEVARTVPDDAIVLETDCPYLTPLSRRRTRNEPAYIVETLDAVASLRSVTRLTLAVLTTANARRLFRLPSADAPGPAAPYSRLSEGQP